MKKNSGHSLGGGPVEGRRFRSTWDATVGGLMALLLSALTAGAFVHELRPLGARPDSVARSQAAGPAPRG